MKVKKFLAKNSIYFTTAVGIGILLYLIGRWADLPVIQRIVCFMFIAVTAHEWEEKLFGFNALNAKNLGVSTKEVDEGIGHFALFFLTLYVGLVPLFFPQIVWLSATCMVLGILEMLSHVAAIRMSGGKKFNPAGLITAFTILPGLSIYGFYYMIGSHLMQPIWWLYAFLNLFIPLVFAQILSVKALGVNYRQFIKNAFSSIVTGKNHS
jgi:hypothetical protein